MKATALLAAVAAAVGSMWLGAPAWARGPVAGGGGGIAAAPLQVTFKDVIPSVVEPTYLTYPPADTHRIFYTERVGRIRLIKDGVLQPNAFLDITALININSPEGALGGLAFHPDYANNGYFYVTYMNLVNDSVLARFHVSANPDVADPASESILLTVVQPDTTHNVGWIGFGPDGYLYVASGDGGNGTLGVFAQNLDTLLGKILRLDVDGGVPYGIPPGNPFVNLPGRDEIWAYGLRNPWRLSFDRLTHDLWLGDVGQSSREEIDFLPAGTPGGTNFGWNCMEGLICHVPATGCTCGAAGLTAPVHSYDHLTGCAAIGGYVYRGSAITALVGKYVFGDVCTGKVWALDPASGTRQQLFSLAGVYSLGEDSAGELYVLTPSSIVKIVIVDCNGNNVPDAQDVVQGTSLDCDGNGIPDECEQDCNTNGVADQCDITAGTSVNLNGNGIPDECDDFADLDGDGHVAINDFLILLSHWGPCPQPCIGGCLADLDHNCSVATSDLLTLLSNWD